MNNSSDSNAAIAALLAAIRNDAATAEASNSASKPSAGAETDKLKVESTSSVAKRPATDQPSVLQKRLTVQDIRQRMWLCECSEIFLSHLEFCEHCEETGHKGYQAKPQTPEGQSPVQPVLGHQQFESPQDSQSPVLVGPVARTAPILEQQEATDNESPEGLIPSSQSDAGESHEQPVLGAQPEPVQATSSSDTGLEQSVSLYSVPSLASTSPVQHGVANAHTHKGKGIANRVTLCVNCGLDHKEPWELFNFHLTTDPNTRLRRCALSFQSQKGKSTADRIYCCDCGMRFASWEDLDSGHLHGEICPARGPSTICFLCFRNFTTPAEMLNHKIEFKHLYECDFCEQYFVDRMSHKRHLVSCPSRHAPLQPASGPVEQRQSLPEMGADGVLFHRVLQWGFKFKCFDCCRVSGERRWYEGKDALMLHKVKSHQGDSSSSAMTASRIGAHESRPVATANALRHEQATLSGRANSGVSAAGDTASPNVPNACGLCGDPFIHCAALEAHMNTVHERCGTCKIALLDLQALLSHCQKTQHTLPLKINGLTKLEGPSNPQRQDFVAPLNPALEHLPKRSPEKPRQEREVFRCSLCTAPKIVNSVAQVFRHVDRRHSCVTCLSCMQSFESYDNFMIHAKGFNHNEVPRFSELWSANNVQPSRMASLTT